MAKKDKLEAGEFEFKDDLDFPEFNDDEFMGSVNPDVNADNRSPVLDTFTATVSSFAGDLIKPSSIVKTVKDSLPDEYGYTIGAVNEAAGAIGTLYDQAVKEIKPQASRLAKKVDKLVPDDAKFLKSITSKISSIIGDETSAYRGPSREEIEDNNISQALGSIFVEQSRQENENNAKAEAREQIRENVESKRFSSTMNVSSAMALDIQAMRRYGEGINQAYQKKHLELEFRQYFTQQEMLRQLETTGVLLKTQLDAVVKNTGLPEYVKVTNAEKIKSAVGRVFAERAANGLFGPDTPIGGAIKNLKADVMDMVEKAKQSFDDAMFGLEAVEQYQESQAMLSEMGMGESAGTQIGRLLGGMAGGYVRDKATPIMKEVFSQDSKIVQTGHKLKDFVTNPSGHIEDYKNSEEYVQRANDPEKSESFKSKALDWAMGLFREKNPAYAMGNPNEKIDLSNGAKFDNAFHRSVVEIIPGYLSYMVREQRWARTGEDPGLMKYDHTRGEFAGKESIKENIKKTIAKEAGAGSYDWGAEKVMDVLFDDVDIEPDLAFKAKQLITDLSRMRNFNFTPENIRKTKVFEEADEDTKKLFEESFTRKFKPKPTPSGIEGEEEEDPGDADAREKLNTSLKKLQKDMPDFRGGIESFMRLGQGKELVELGIAYRDDDGSYHIDPKKYHEFVRENAVRKSNYIRKAKVRDPDISELDRISDAAPEEPELENKEEEKTKKKSKAKKSKPAAEPAQTSEATGISDDQPTQAAPEPAPVAQPEPAPSITPSADSAAAAPTLALPAPDSSSEEPKPKRRTRRPAVEAIEAAPASPVQDSSAEEPKPKTRRRKTDEPSLAERAEVRPRKKKTGKDSTDIPSLSDDARTEDGLKPEEGVSDMFAKKDIKEIDPGKSPKLNLLEKDNKKALKAVQDTKLYSYKYKPGRGREKLSHTSDEKIGPMAQEVKSNMGDEVAPGGKKLDLIKLNGVTMAAVKAIDQKVDKLKSATGESKFLSAISSNTKDILQILIERKLKLELDEKNNPGGGNNQGGPASATQAIGTLFGAVGTLAATSVSKVAGAASTTLKTLKDSVLKPGGAYIGKKLKDNKENIKDGFTSLVSSSWKAANKVFDVTKDAVLEHVPKNLRRLKNFAGFIKDKATELFNGVSDVYIKGKAKPVLRAMILKAGGYIDSKTGKAITSFNDLAKLKGDIHDEAGNVVLTLKEAAEGLYNTKGKLVKTNFNKLAGFAGKHIMQGVGRLRRFANFAKEKLSSLGSKISDGFDSGDGSWFGGMFSSGTSSEKVYEVLVEIRDTLQGKPTTPHEKILEDKKQSKTVKAKVVKKGKGLIDRVKGFFSKSDKSEPAASTTVAKKTRTKKKPEESIELTPEQIEIPKLSFGDKVSALKKRALALTKRLDTVEDPPATKPKRTRKPKLKDQKADVSEAKVVQPFTAESLKQKRLEILDALHRVQQGLPAFEEKSPKQTEPKKRKTRSKKQEPKSLSFTDRLKAAALSVKAKVGDKLESVKKLKPKVVEPQQPVKNTPAQTKKKKVSTRATKPSAKKKVITKAAAEPEPAVSLFGSLKKKFKDKFFTDAQDQEVKSAKLTKPTRDKAAAKPAAPDPALVEQTLFNLPGYEQLKSIRERLEKTAGASASLFYKTMSLESLSERVREREAAEQKQARAKKKKTTKPRLRAVADPDTQAKYTSSTNAIDVLSNKAREFINNNRDEKGKFSLSKLKNKIVEKPDSLVNKLKSAGSSFTKKLKDRFNPEPLKPGVVKPKRTRKAKTDAPAETQPVVEKPKTSRAKKPVTPTSNLTVTGTKSLKQYLEENNALFRGSSKKDTTAVKETKSKRRKSGPAKPAENIAPTKPQIQEQKAPGWFDKIKSLIAGKAQESADAKPNKALRKGSWQERLENQKRQAAAKLRNVAGVDLSAKYKSSVNAVDTMTDKVKEFMDDNRDEDGKFTLSKIKDKIKNAKEKTNKNLAAATADKDGARPKSFLQGLRNIGKNTTNKVKEKIGLIKPEEPVKPKRTRRTKAQIEADKKAGVVKPKRARKPKVEPAQELPAKQTLKEKASGILSKAGGFLSKAVARVKKPGILTKPAAAEPPVKKTRARKPKLEQVAAPPAQTEQPNTETKKTRKTKTPGEITSNLTVTGTKSLKQYLEENNKLGAGLFKRKQQETETKPKRRKGNWQDKLDSQKENDKKRVRNVAAVDLAAKYKSDKNVIDTMMEKAAGVFDFLKNSAGSVFDLATNAFGKGKGGILRTVGNLIKSPFKAAGNVMKGGLNAARAIGTPIVNAVNAASKLGTVSRVIGIANTVRNATMIAGLATGGSTAAATGIIGTGITALTAAITSPVIVGAAAIGAAAYGGYKLYKYATRNDANAYDDIRLKQYGLGATDKDKEFNHYVFALEDYLQDGRVGYLRGKAYLHDKKIEEKELLELFDIDKEDSQRIDAFTSWLSKRFKPFFITNQTALFAIDPKAKFSGIEKFTVEDKLKYLNAISFESGPYDESVSPFKGLEKLNTEKDYALNAIKVLIDKLTKQQKDPKKLPIPEVPKDPSKDAADPKQDKTKPLGIDKPKIDLNDPRIKTNKVGKVLGQGDGDGKTNDSATLGDTSESTATKSIPAAQGPMADGSTGSQFIRVAKDASMVGVNPSLEKNLKAMAQEFGEKTGAKIGLNSGYRDTKKQAELYRANPAKAARPGTSMHEFGLAVDINSKDADKLEELGLMRKYGFTRPVGGEPWHVEPAGIQQNLSQAKNNSGWASSAIESGVGQGGGGVGADRNSKLGLGRRDPNAAKNLTIAKDVKVQDKPADQTALALPNKPQDQTSQTAPAASPAAAPAETLTQKKTPLDAPSAADSGKPNPQAAAGAKPASFGDQVEANEASGTARYVQPKADKVAIGPASKQGDQTVQRGNVPAVSVTPGNKESVKAAIAEVAKAQGEDPSLMQTFAAIESGLNPGAKAGSSSAQGLFQFIKGTWKAMMAKNARKYDLDPNVSPSDVKASTIIASEYIKDNRRALKSVKSDVNAADLYMAHFLGTGGARKMLSAPPDAIAANIAPKAAAANKAIFYDNNQPVTVGALYEKIKQKVSKKAKDFGINLNLPADASGKPSSAPATASAQSSSTPTGDKPQKPSESTPSSQVRFSPAGGTAPAPTPAPEPATPATSERVSMVPQSNSINNPSGKADTGQAIPTKSLSELRDIMMEQLGVQKEILQLLKAKANTPAQPAPAAPAAPAVQNEKESSSVKQNPAKPQPERKAKPEDKTLKSAIDLSRMRFS